MTDGTGDKDSSVRESGAGRVGDHTSAPSSNAGAHLMTVRVVYPDNGGDLTTLDMWEGNRKKAVPSLHHALDHYTRWEMAPEYGAIGVRRPFCHIGIVPYGGHAPSMKPDIETCFMVEMADFLAPSDTVRVKLLPSGHSDREICVFFGYGVHVPAEDEKPQGIIEVILFNEDRTDTMVVPITLTGTTDAAGLYAGQYGLLFGNDWRTAFAQCKAIHPERVIYAGRDGMDESGDMVVRIYPANVSDSAGTGPVTAPRRRVKDKTVHGREAIDTLRESTDMSRAGTSERVAVPRDMMRRFEISSTDIAQDFLDSGYVGAMLSCRFDVGPRALRQPSTPHWASPAQTEHFVVTGLRLPVPWEMDALRAVTINLSARWGVCHSPMIGRDGALRLESGRRWTLREGPRSFSGRIGRDTTVTTKQGSYRLAEPEREGPGCIDLRVNSGTGRNAGMFGLIAAADLHHATLDMGISDAPDRFSQAWLNNAVTVETVRKGIVAMTGLASWYRDNAAPSIHTGSMARDGASLRVTRDREERTFGYGDEFAFGGLLLRLEPGPVR